MSEVVPHKPQPVAGLRLMEALEEAGAITETGLSVEVVGELTLPQCKALAAMFGRVKRMTSWVLGDLLVYCEGVFGVDVTYGDIAEATGLAEQTVTNLASVSRRVPPSRRVDGLPHSMHETVAKLPPSKQRELLGKAKREGWTRTQLREEINPPPPPSKSAPGPDMRLLVLAARDLLGHVDMAGDNAVCRVRDVERLRAALGEGD